ncbi:MAG: MATE family efflux transporter [Lachnospiraceae bacterium]|jgi:putative MATE family efflux protein|nr:MATE family efflux transporter [Lachnospiraceae bacterium]
MASNRKQINIMDESRSVSKTILLLAWPVFVEQIFSTLVSFADTAMVGSLGATATASISISNSPIFLLNGIIMALGVGITALVARAAGAGDHQLVRKLMRHAMMVILYIGLPITLLTASLSRLIPLWMGAGEDILDMATQYNLIVSFGRLFNLAAMVLNSAFRGYGDTKTPMKLNLMMNIINVIGNYLLINPTRMVSLFGYEFTMPGAGWGVNGAAVATAIGMLCAGLMAFKTALSHKNPYRISFESKQDLLPDKTLSKQIFRISFPAMLERICMSSSGIFVTSSIAMLGTVSIAANSLSLSAESLSYMPAFAFQTAITTLVGQALGAEKPHLAEKFVHTTMRIGVIVMCFTGLGLYVFASNLIGVFTPDQEVIQMASECLRLMALIQPIQVAAWIFSGVLRGSGDTSVNFYISAATNWGIRTLFSVLAIRAFGLDLYATYIVMMVEIAARLLLLYLRYRTGKWKTVMTKMAA